MNYPLHLGVTEAGEGDDGPAAATDLFSRSTEQLQAAIEQAGREITPKMERMVRGGDREAVEAIKKAGVTIVTPTSEQTKAWRKVALASAKASAGHIYSVDLLKQLQAAVDAYRKNGK